MINQVKMPIVKKVPNLTKFILLTDTQGTDVILVKAIIWLKLKKYINRKYHLYWYINWLNLKILNIDEN